MCKKTFLFYKIFSWKFGKSQVENSEARQFLQPAQYCYSCNRGVMPVLPVNTVPNVGSWRSIPWQYWWNSEVGISLTVGILLVYYGRSTDYFYWQNTDKGGVPTLGIVPVDCCLYTTSKYGISTDMEVSSTVGILLVY